MASGYTSSNNGAKRVWVASCALCNTDHPIKSCHRFLRLDPVARFNVLSDFAYCVNCLARSHTQSECKVATLCRICHDEHNTLIHEAPQVHDLPRRTVRDTRRDVPRQPVKSPLRRDPDVASHKSPRKRQNILPTTRSKQSRDSEQQTVRSIMHDIQLIPRSTAPFSWSKVFVPTAQIRIAINDEPDVWHLCRVGINKLSTHSRIATSLARQLQLTTFDFHGATFARLQATSRLSRFKWGKEICALMTNDLPRRPYESPINEDPTSDYSENTLADTDPMANTPIEMELGADEYHTIWRSGAQMTRIDYVVAEQTAIGYTFTGPIGHIW